MIHLHIVTSSIFNKKNIKQCSFKHHGDCGVHIFRPKEACACSLLQCSYTSLSLVKHFQTILLKLNNALLWFRFQHLVSACVGVKSLNQIASVSLSIGPLYLHQYQTPAEMGLITTDIEMPQIISVSGCCWNFTANCDNGTCIILPLYNLELGHAFQSSCEMEEMAQKVAVSINLGQRIKER